MNSSSLSWRPDKGGTPVPTPAQRARLFARCRTPDHIIDHGMAVAQCAGELARLLSCPVDLPLLEAACLLHDMARTRQDHPRVAGELLTEAGFSRLGELVSRHHDLPPGADTESALLYLADKMVKGTQRVSIHERFLGSRARCTTPEAMEGWSRRRTQVTSLIGELELPISEFEVFYE